MQPYRRLTLLFSLLFFSQITIAESTLIFEGAWIAEAPPVSKVMAAYMEISNPSDKITKIVSANSASFKKISFHQTQQKNGMASMKHIDTLAIPAKGKFILEAGSYHMMLFNPVKRFKAGDLVNFEFKLDSGDVIKLAVPVKKQMTDNMTHDHSQHQHH